MRPESPPVAEESGEHAPGITAPGDPGRATRRDVSTADWLATTMAGGGTNAPPPPAGAGHFVLGFVVGFATAILLLILFFALLISLGGTGS